MKYNRKSLLSALVLGLLLSCPWFFPQIAAAEIPEQVAKKARNATTLIRVDKADGSFDNGSGFFIAPDKIVTNVHVVAGSKKITVIGSEYPNYYVEGVIGFNPEYDLVVLKVSGKGMPLSLSTGQIDEQIFAVGYPSSELEYQVKEGKIYSIRKEGKVHSIRKSDGQLRLTAKDFPSNKNTVFSRGISGGPVLNLKGEVVGIAVSADESVFSYAAPSDKLKALLSRSVQPLSEWQMTKAVRAYVFFGQATESLSGILKANEGAGKEAQELYDKVIKDCTNSIDLYPSARAYLMRGATYLRKAKVEIGSEKYKEAIEDLTKAIEDLTIVIDQFIPDDIKAYKDRGAANLFLGQLVGQLETSEKARTNYNSAVFDYGKVITLNPDDAEDAEAYYYRGAAYQLMGQQEKAAEDFRRAKQLDPSIGR